MTDRETRLLFGILALQLNYISKEQLIQAISIWMDKHRRDIADVLIELRFITDAQRDALAGLVSAHLARTTGRGFPEGYVPDARETMATVVMPKDGSVAQAPTQVLGEPLPPDTPEQRFRLGSEIGRGGLARVVEATDTEIGRTVALKLMLEDSPGDALQRFRYEARITGRLEHPNIVPVHEVGALPGTKEVFFCMKRIYGRDMHQVIREGKWKQRRLVEAFRDVCHAVAYAHAKGVIHRDLKPANVMLGDFGEVLVVDWGLAIARDGAAPPPGAPRAAAAKSPSARPITEEGEILGTPAYMPPEQARGEREAIDERSDVYSLGAILYEILAGRAPFEGKTPQEVVRKVATQPLMPPSSRAPAPAELEAICLRAMARGKADRYPSAAELAADVESYLEGTKERERRESLAAEQVARGREAIERWRKLSREASAAFAAAADIKETIPDYEPPERKKTLWDLEDRARALERESITAFTEAVGALASALSNVPGHREARELKAELYWERFLEAEAEGDEKQMQLARQTAEQFNDGVLDARLRGDGTLAVRARAYGCRCLSQGRPVRSEELAVLGLHAWSGRAPGGAGGDGLQEAEPAEPVHLRLHSAACEPHALAGAQVWAFRYEEDGRLLIPVTPHGGATPVPRLVLDALFGNSPFRPRGGGVYLGRTPIARQPWPMGSWLLVVVAEGRAPQRVPILVERQQDVDLEVTLWELTDLPAGFLPVAAGPFAYGGDRVSLSPTSLERVDLPDFALARDPVTCREYAAFLNDLRKRSPEEAARRVPRAAEHSGYAWPLDGEAGWAVPTAAWLARAPAALRPRAARLLNATADWEEDWPVSGISWEDGMAYARWASLRSGRLFHLPHERQWEKAARGPDRRLFPWGNHFDGSWANLSGSLKGELRPAVIGSFPTDESPYGVRGMAGNSADRCLNAPENLPGRRITRGGSWARSTAMARAAYRSGGVPREVNMAIGIRLAAGLR